MVGPIAGSSYARERALFFSDALTIFRFWQGPEVNMCHLQNMCAMSKYVLLGDLFTGCLSEIILNWKGFVTIWVKRSRLRYEVGLSNEATFPHWPFYKACYFPLYFKLFCNLILLS